MSTGEVKRVAVSLRICFWIIHGITDLIKIINNISSIYPKNYEQ